MSNDDEFSADFAPVVNTPSPLHRAPSVIRDIKKRLTREARNLLGNEVFLVRTRSQRK